MDPEEGKQGETRHKTIAEQRKQLTPGNDDESDEQIYSDKEDDMESSPFESKLSKNDKNSQAIEDEQKWEDSPYREHGQSMSLEPRELQQVAEQATKQEQKQESEQNSEGNQNKEEAQNDWDKQEKQEKKTESKRQSQPRNRQRVSKQRSAQQNPDYKCVTTPYDSKFVFAAYYLLWQQLSKLAKDNQCLIKLNPYFSSRCIKVYGQDEKKCQDVANWIDESVNDIQVIELGKFEAQSGLQLSYKYLQMLLKQKITFFKDPTQKFKTASYYICGKVSNKILYQKISEIKNTRFTWIHLFRYQNTRSYRAILRKIFETPQIHAFALQKFKARQIQIGELKRDFPFPSKQTKRGVLILLTYQGQKRTTIHQEIQQSLCTFIKETFAVFCFTFKRKKQSYVNKYTPKVDKVTMFFISEKATNYQTSYLYIIVKNSDFEELKERIITEVESMKLLITGRRFFKNLAPGKQTFNLGNCREFSYPRVYPYSWSMSAKKGAQFDWKQQFQI